MIYRIRKGKDQADPTWPMKVWTIAWVEAIVRPGKRKEDPEQAPPSDRSSNWKRQAAMELAEPTRPSLATAPIEMEVASLATIG